VVVGAASGYRHRSRDRGLADSANSPVDDHRKAREIQTSLIQDVSAAVAKVTLTGELLATLSVRKENTNGTSTFDASLLDWEIAKAAIGAQLGSYFAGAKLHGERLPVAWSRYGRAVDDLYYLSTTELPDRCVRTKRLMGYLASGAGELCREGLDRRAMGRRLQVGSGVGRARAVR
jgi:hypothetical protein